MCCFILFVFFRWIFSRVIATIFFSFDRAVNERNFKTVDSTINGTYQYDVNLDYIMYQNVHFCRSAVHNISTAQSPKKTVPVPVLVDRVKALGLLYCLAKGFSVRRHLDEITTPFFSHVRSLPFCVRFPLYRSTTKSYLGFSFFLSLENI